MYTPQNFDDIFDTDFKVSLCLHSSGHRKADRRRRRFSRGHQIEITDNSTIDSTTKPAVKVNNYVEDESPSTSTSVSFAYSLTNAD